MLLFVISIFSHSITGALAQQAPESTNNTATATYATKGTDISAISNQISTGVTLPLIDPGGRLLGCEGQPLASYAGFSMALYEPDASGLDLGRLLPLEPTTAANGVPPNISNINPFPLSSEGRYNFLLNESTGQTDSNATYILVISPPGDSSFGERRILVEMLGVQRSDPLSSVTLSYRATSLDGQPIGLDGNTELTRQLEIRDAAYQSITIFEIGVDTVICEADQIKIIKSADRSAAQPGDIVVYRLNIKNLSAANIEAITAIDIPPVGFELLEESVSGQVAETSVAVETSVAGDRVRFRAIEPLAPDQVLDIFYAVRITPDALRGSGRNSVSLTARRTDNGFRLQNGPSEHRVTLDPGILSDCGTLIGRVFEDKNFDGEQQTGEAGIPNAVIFLDDGNRVVTDADGLFSVQKMLPGQRTGTLDISSLPGYTLAANLYFNERNSLSRLVNLSPGGLVRMNFGVTPTFQEVPES